MERKTISNNVNLTFLPNEKFNRNRISISFIMPNEKAKATMYAVLPTLMERGYQDYPDMCMFSKKLSSMYGAEFSAITAVVGQNRILRFTVMGIKNQYCLNGEDLLSEMTDVLLDVIFRPCVEDGGFIKGWMEVEKVKLREEIEGEINDKRGYCVKMAQRKFFKDDINGVERLGYIEDVDGINAADLYNCYKEMLENSIVEIFVTAQQDEAITAKFAAAFADRKENNNHILPIKVMDKTEAETYSESMNIVQGKVCLYYTSDRKLTEDERYHMLVASSIYGGTASSRLFKNVREKQSLCYYCAAAYNGFTGSMRVDSGVEHQNCDKVVEAVQKELSDLISGEITEKEISETKLVLLNSLDAVHDGLHGLEAWYLNEAIRGTWTAPEQVKEKVQAVTAQNIRDVLSLLHLNVVYKLTK
ncbi:MAG: insulinase family protein [Oscillospiraceae bacterium]|nr:insulinase family protein [Oscillospiraceae bacterium]